MMPGDDVLTMPSARRVEVFTGTARRRRWSAEAKAQMVAESYETTVGEVAARYSVSRTQLFAWRRDARGLSFAPIVVEDPADARSPADSTIEIELAGARVRIGRAAEPKMAVAVIGALRARR